MVKVQLAEIAWTSLMEAHSQLFRLRPALGDRNLLLSLHPLQMALAMAWFPKSRCRRQHLRWTQRTNEIHGPTFLVAGRRITTRIPEAQPKLTVLPLSIVLSIPLLQL